MLVKHFKNIILFISSGFLILVPGIYPVFAQSSKKKVKIDKPARTFRFKTIVIDPGHGGKDPGAHGARSNEKTIALKIGNKLKQALNKEMSGINVIMTRTTDKFVELHKRAEIANENQANLFISIHCNSSPQRVGTRKGVLLVVYGFHRKQEQMEALRENASIYIEKDYKKNTMDMAKMPR